MKGNNMLVLARKYNDIFYAMSTKEWELSKEHYLLMITDCLDKANYPMEKTFNKVFTVHTKRGTYGYFKSCLEIKKIAKSLSYSYVSFSNPAMIANYCTIDIKKIDYAVLLEDGLMNYYHFRPSERLSKRILALLLGINISKVLSSIAKTYLLKPDRAKFYIGSKEKLELKSETFIESLSLSPKIKGRRIFVGQPLYNVLELSVEDYSDMVNKIIEEYKIDFYLPHNNASNRENIRCEIFNLADSLATLEIFAVVYDFTIYSFSSSVLYTTKLINPKIKTYAVSNNKLDWVKEENIINETVDEIIKLR